MIKEMHHWSVRRFEKEPQEDLNLLKTMTMDSVKAKESDFSDNAGKATIQEQAGIRRMTGLSTTHRLQLRLGEETQEPHAQPEMVAPDPVEPPKVKKGALADNAGEAATQEQTGVRNMPYQSVRRLDEKVRDDMIQDYLKDCPVSINDLCNYICDNYHLERNDKNDPLKWAMEHGGFSEHSVIFDINQRLSEDELNALFRTK